MGLGPWAQAEQNRDLVRGERSRFRRIVDRELKAVFADKRVSIPDNIVIEMLERIKGKITPPRTKRR